MFPQGTVFDGLSNIVTTNGKARVQFPRPGATTPEPTRSRKDSPQHTTSLGVVYVNQIGKDGFGQQPFRFPTGSIVVRESTLTGSTSPYQLMAMLKREKNFNKKANDWEFLTVSGDLKRILKREKAGKCLKCHAEAAQNDFVFSESQRR